MFMSLHDMDNDCGRRIFTNEGSHIPCVKMPKKSLWLSAIKLDSRGLYLLDDAETFYLYVGSQLAPNLLRSLFGVDSINTVAQANALHFSGPRGADDFSARVFGILEHLRWQRSFSEPSHHQPVVVLHPLIPNGANQVYQLLIEDKCCSYESYADFLCSMHQKITNKMDEL